MEYEPPDGPVVIGIDPDTSCVGIAAVSMSDGNLVGVRAVKSKGSLKGAAKVVATIDKCRGCLVEFVKEMGNPPVSAILVEDQTVAYTAAKGINPGKILGLSQVAGALVSEGCYETHTALVQPSTWKGSVPKQIHQNRILSKFGVVAEPVGSAQNSGYSRPKDPNEKWGDVVGVDSLSKSDWKHVVDAIGIAVYGRDYILEEIRKAEE